MMKGFKILVMNFFFFKITFYTKIELLKMFLPITKKNQQSLTLLGI